MRRRTAGWDRTPVPLLGCRAGPILACRMLPISPSPVVLARSWTGFRPGRLARFRAAFAAWGVAIALVMALVAPAWAAAGPTRLSDASASPGSGTTLTTIDFAVTYRNREGSPADWVRVQVAGSTHDMSTSGTDWKGGVQFRWSGRLPAGTHAVAFEAMSRDRFSDALGGGSVSITVPPTPPPTPRPTPAPTPKPTAAPTPKATAAPTPRPTTAPTARSTTEPTVTPTPAATPGSPATPGAAAPMEPAASPTGSIVPTAVPTGSASAPTQAEPSATPSDATIALVPRAGTGTSGGGGADRPRSDGSSPGPLAALTSAMSALDGARPILPLGLVATLVTTSGVVASAMAFGMFGKRRRDREQPAADDVLAAQAATGISRADPFGTAHGPTAAAAAAAILADPEMAMPRWRRPSLLEARRADPVRDAPAPAPRLTFDHGLVGALDGRERRLIGYNVVRLLDTPDELRGAEIGFLDQGDEVQLLEKRGVYWEVLCPDGRQGWIHKMTLGEVVGQAPMMSPPTATMPIAAETWTMGDDVDGDVLTAYLESRRRA